MDISWKSVARDTAIIFLLTFLGGFVIGLATSTISEPTPMAMMAIAISNLLFAVVGFCIAGCLSPHQRFRHLGVVLVVVWLLGIINIFLVEQLNVVTWVFSVIPLALAMLVGGAISFLFVRDREPSPEPSEGFPTESTL